MQLRQVFHQARFAKPRSNARGQIRQRPILLLCCITQDVANLLFHAASAALGAAPQTWSYVIVEAANNQLRHRLAVAEAHSISAYQSRKSAGGFGSRMGPAGFWSPVLGPGAWRRSAPARAYASSRAIVSSRSGRPTRKHSARPTRSVPPPDVSMARRAARILSTASSIAYSGVAVSP